MSIVSMFALQAQERTVNVEFPINTGTYKEVALSASDVFVKTTRDTTDYIFKYTGGGYVNKIAAHVKCDTIDGADTISVQILGYDFYGDPSANVIIAADTANVASTANIILVDDYMTAADEFSFRYYAIRVRHLGVGLGCKATKVELKLYN